MKKTATSRLLRTSVATLVPLFTLASPLSAAMVYWDTNGPTVGAGTDPTGSWDAGGTPNWNADPGGEGGGPGVWTANDSAVFSAGNDAIGMFTVTVVNNQAASALTIEEGHVVLAGNAVNLGTTGIVTVAPGAKLSIPNFIGALTQSLLGSTSTSDGSHPVVRLDGSTLRGVSDAAGTTFLDSDFSIELGVAGGTIETTNTGTSSTIFAGDIKGVDSTLTKTGSGEFRHQGAKTANNTFSKLVVNEGLFRLGSNVVGGIQQTQETGFGAVPAAFTPDAITLANGGAIGQSLGITLHANRGITLGVGGGAFVTSAGSLTVPGAITGPGSLSKLTSGTLTLNGNSDYAGVTNVSAGVLIVGHGNALGATTAGTVVSGTGEVRVTGTASNFTTNEEFFITGAGSGNGAITVLNGANATFAGEITLDGDATVAVSTSSIGTFSSPTAFSSLTGSLTLQGLAGSGSGRISGAISLGAASLFKQQTGTWILSGANTYGGVTTIGGGMLQFAKQVSLYNNTPSLWTDSDIFISSGATLAVNVGGAGEFTAANLDTLKAIGSATGGFASGSAFGIDTSNAVGGTFLYSSNIANPNGGANVLGLTKLGSGSLVLAGTNTYTGTTTVLGGTLSEAATGSIADTSPLTVNGATAVFDLGANHNDTVGTVTLQGGGSITGTGTSTLTVGSGEFAMQSGSASAILAGANIPLNKTTAGTVTLSGANTYTGATTVTEGSLVITGSLNGTAGVSVSGTLAGTGTINVAAGGDVAVLAGGKLSPGTSAGTLSVNLNAGRSFNLSAAVTSPNSQALVFELDTLLTSDRLVVAGGTIEIGASVLEFDDFAFTVLAGFSPGIGTDFILLDGNVPISGTLGLNLTGTVGGFDATLQLGDNGNDLILHVVPEPGSAAFLLGGLALLAPRRRRGCA